MKIAEQIYDKLDAAFSPEVLEVRDDSARHAGHAGNPSGDGETHFHVVMRAEAMGGLTRVARHRAVHAALGDLARAVHALSLDLDAPAT